MVENYQYERVDITLDGTTPVTAVAAPPEGISYRIFHVNGYNGSGGARYLYGRINIPTWNVFPCFESLQNNGVAFVTSYVASALAEYPTIAVLDNTDEVFQLWTNDTCTNNATVSYEIVDQTGQRTFRNALAQLVGTTPVKLLAAPTGETVYRVLNVNAYNTSGGARVMYLNIGSAVGATSIPMVEMTIGNNAMFRSHNGANQAPFPPIVLTSITDDLYVSLDDTGGDYICAAYEVLDRRVI